MQQKQEWTQVFEFSDDQKSLSFEKFYQFQSPKNMRQSGQNEQAYISIDFFHIPQEQKIQFKGLINEGTTCYLNSLIQTLFFIREFKNAIYKMPTIQSTDSKANLEKSIPFCLQRIFYNLQVGSAESVRTFELLQAFGWTNNERNQQQDVNEFNCILSDQLEIQMQNTEV
jgi:ubiquitin carboxyl-terminal hydrolase 7